MLTRRLFKSSSLMWNQRMQYHKVTAKDLMEKSCYTGINFSISQNASVYEAIKKMAGIELGCLAVSGDDNTIVGIVTERDYLKKVELQDRAAKSTKVGEIMTMRARLVVAKEDEMPGDLMKKMMDKDIRHLPVVNNDGGVIGMLSIKDIVREINKKHSADVDLLTNFALGKGGHFVMD